MTGYDSFTSFSPLKVVGDHTLQSDVQLSSVDIEVTLKVVISHPERGVVEDSVVVRTGMEGMGLKTSWLFAIDGVKLRNIRLGSLVRNLQV